MNTATPHLALATIIAVRHLGYDRLAAPPPMAPQAVSVLIVAAIALTFAFVSVMAGTARRLAVLMAEFFQLAVTITTYALIVVIAVVLIVIVLTHH